MGVLLQLGGKYIDIEGWLSVPSAGKIHSCSF
jgi:hypothetical protein